MSKFPRSRTALARLFVNMALIAVPDGMPAPYTHLLKASDMLKREADWLKSRDTKEQSHDDT